MFIGPLLGYLEKIKEFNYLIENALTGQEAQLYGISGSQKSLLAAAFVQRLKKPLLYLVETSQRGKEVFNDLNSLLPGWDIHYFPALEVLPFEVIAQSHETQRKRVEVLHSLIQKENNIVITTPEALRKVTASPEHFRAALLSLQAGQRVNLEDLLDRLVRAGYQRVDMIEDRGQFALRGGILDIYAATAAHPCRLELFDDEIDSIRIFSIENQRSISQVPAVSICPATEFFFWGTDRQTAVERIRKETETALANLEKKGNRESFNSLFAKAKEVCENIIEGQRFPGYEQYLPYFYEKKHTLLEYFSVPPLCIIDEPNRQKESFLLSEKEMHETYKILLEKGRILAGQIENYLSWEDLNQELAKTKKVYYTLLPKKPPGQENIVLLGVAAKSPSLFMGKTKLLVDELKEWRRQKQAVIILVNSKERAERLRQNLWDLGVEAALAGEDTKLVPEKVYIFRGYLNSGFEFPTWKVSLLTEHELYFQPKKHLPRKMFREEKRITVLEDLKTGDYVVHTNYGIGKYLGIEKLAVGEAERDYLVIKYLGEDKLYVPTEQAGLLQKYAGQEGYTPKLSKLGGAEWNKVKNRVKAAVRELAEDLLDLYATRQSQPGYAFSPDLPWQKDFEEAFPFEETPDQITAIEEVKGDMGKGRPMDRLLCGDVGYGKTEVAIRAAFKAVTCGKQVAVLVPTTVLAQQHYNTFRERCEGFAVNIAVLSRFRSVAEQKKIIRQLKQGQVDIVIGTHRLLSNDVAFKDLGLLVVDEEQRFGVSHKEKIKKLKKTVDVLTLTATPIPRTLYMSLVGVRDMSIIETPPEDRYPVQTFVVEHSQHLVREAIRREIGRGGQVYYVHNRIEDIEKVARMVSELVPEASVGLGHGRMSEEQLEKVMIDFIEGKIDVLVCTTIIESGLDISNVNTLIVDNAEKMGLSQLYQLRGRVGRSNRIAYAYLTYNKDKVLSEVAEKRLNAIREFTELGSGFKIAMRDLEIRGAGNILGAEQHGHVAAVGFDLYCRMLEEAVREIKGEKLPKEKEVTVDLQLKAYIPQEYIYDAAVKIDFYQRIFAAKETGEIDRLAEELADRFGAIPDPLLNLLKVASVKIAANKSKVQSINQEKGFIKLKMEDGHGLTGKNLIELARRYRRQISFNTSNGLDIIISTKSLDSRQVLPLLEEIILEISAIAQKEAALV